MTFPYKSKVQGVGNIDLSPRRLGCQYAVELIVAGVEEGGFLDHEMMEIAIKAALDNMLKGAGFACYKTEVGSVVYETSYPTPKPEDL